MTELTILFPELYRAIADYGWTLRERPCVSGD